MNSYSDLEGIQSSHSVKAKSEVSTLGLKCKLDDVLGEGYHIVGYVPQMKNKKDFLLFVFSSSIHFQCSTTFLVCRLFDSIALALPAVRIGRAIV